MSTWNLDALYLGFDDSNFQKDFKRIETLINELDTISNNLDAASNQETLMKIITTQRDFVEQANKLGAYIFLRFSTDTTDKEVADWNNRFDALESKTAKPLAMINTWISKLDLNTIDTTMSPIKEHLFWLSEIKEEATHLLDSKTEDAIAKMTLNASNTWEQLRSHLTSTLSVDLDGEAHTLSSIRNLAYSDNSDTRKKAYEAELASYDKIKDSIAFSLNSLKGQSNVLVELRGYDSVLEKTLASSRMSKNTLDAMLEAMKESLPYFHKYLKHKAKLLGHTNGLPFYDLFAPMGSSSKTFNIEESKEYLVKNFEAFSTDISDLITRAYDENWIDFYPKKGKSGGAFCMNLPSIKQSRVLTNYDNGLGDVVTLAHELGHAYHGYCIQNHSPLNTSYSMPVAETASIFNETIILNAALKDTVNADEKLALIENSLQDATQVIVDILSRYYFETNVIEKRKDSFLFSEDLEEIMIQAQKDAYGDGLDHNYLHPYMWINKSHYYRASLSFYNFPYAFGLLFAKGLYAIYQKEGQSFVATYNKLLNATTINKVEDVALIAGIDLSDKNFWRNSLKVITNSIEEFIQLTSQ